ncbi:hypothetical protein A464_2559 [Salmonella bongori N268-08]|uniref:Uncharacterized protein n=1 Tax=Salmonella bongori N268-08 TaxID=1197719 RepID=S5MYQ6_SALBN|nr:hypothetical protein A464_2559 [Salmonella bongori N268-08]
MFNDERNVSGQKLPATDCVEHLLCRVPFTSALTIQAKVEPPG